MSTRSWRPTVVVTVCVVVVVGCWLLLVPRGGGPDEPSHVVRGAALVRGDLEGEPWPEGGLTAFELPAWMGAPDPGCYAFQPTVPATCIAAIELPSGEGLVLTKADEYPVWGHLPAGVGSLVEWPEGSAFVVRAASALLPALVVAAAVVAALRASGGRLRAASVLLAVTPMAWFTFAVVNPSSFAIAGGIAVWVALMRPHHRPDWLFAAGWAALVLPRRDGLVWACVIMILVVVVDDRPLLRWWRALGRWPAVVVAGTTVLAVGYGVSGGSRVNRLVALAPLALVAAELVRRGLDRWAPRAGRRLLGLVLVGFAGVLVLVGLAATRPDGLDRSLFRAIVGNTGDHLREAIGVLGWLDTPVPPTAIFAWSVGLGVLVAVALAADARRALTVAVSVVLVGAVLPWFLELVQGDDSGTYWQGRYTLPLLVGAPVVLGAVRLHDAAAERRAAIAVAAVSVAVVNVAFLAAARRWGVGTAGSMLPWEWDTYGAPLPPLALVVVHVAASVALAVAVVQRGPDAAPVASPG